MALGSPAMCARSIVRCRRGRRSRGRWSAGTRSLSGCAETLTRGTSGGLVFQGPAGVGKSRLAQECLARAEIDGRATARAGATVATHSVPLGALVHLLPPAVLDRAGEPLALFGEVATALRERSPERPFVLLVDDLPLLDAASVVLLAQLLDAGALFLLATAARRRRCPSPSPTCSGDRTSSGVTSGSSEPTRWTPFCTWPWAVRWRPRPWPRSRGSAEGTPCSSASW